ncbi:MAG TPA: hypothetical protein VKA59_21295 [Vicinamibacterales bacterium]|jgi:CheY-like chemotaxis protein|nr:hypothetical protein [Vicinamibacterales bacterium]
MDVRPEVVAIFNTSEDCIDMLRIAFEHAGFVVVTAFTNKLRDGEIDLETFMRQHQPRVVIYDIAVPYEHNWRLYQHVRSAPACRDVDFVVTTTNAHQVRQLAGSEPVHEIVGKPYDLDEIVHAVKEAGAESLKR